MMKKERVILIYETSKLVQGSIGRAFGRKLKNEFGSLDDAAGHHRTRESPWRPHISAPILQTSNAANTNLETTQV